MKKTNRAQGSRCLAPLLTILAVLLILFMPFNTRLTVREYKSNKLIMALPIKKGETFGLRFTHSINLSHVTDELEWTGKELIARSSLFTSFGVGMPVLADGIGTEMHNTGDGFLITGIDKVQENNSIPVMLQEVPDHHLLYRGEEISLRDAAKEVPFIKISVESISAASALAHGRVFK